MPVTAKLSKAFYERLGEDIANELVEWFNLVDATYRSDLRDINELNFARFDAKMEQRLAQFEAKFEQRLAQSETKVEQRLAQMETKVEQRLAQMETKFDQRLAQMETKFEQRLAETETKFEQRFGKLEARIEAVAVDVRTSLRTEFVDEMNRRFDAQNRLMLAGWGALIAAVLGVLLKVF